MQAFKTFLLIVLGVYRFHKQEKVWLKFSNNMIWFSCFFYLIHVCFSIMWIFVLPCSNIILFLVLEQSYFHFAPFINLFILTRLCLLLFSKNFHEKFNVIYIYIFFQQSFSLLLFLSSQMCRKLKTLLVRIDIREYLLV